MCFLLVRTMYGWTRGKQVQVRVHSWMRGNSWEDLQWRKQMQVFSTVQIAQCAFETQGFLLVRMTCLCVRGETRCRWKYILEWGGRPAEKLNAGFLHCANRTFLLVRMCVYEEKIDAGVKVHSRGGKWKRKMQKAIGFEIETMLWWFHTQFLKWKKCLFRVLRQIWHLYLITFLYTS